MTKYKVSFGKDVEKMLNDASAEGWRFVQIFQEATGFYRIVFEMKAVFKEKK